MGMKIQLASQVWVASHLIYILTENLFFARLIYVEIKKLTQSLVGLGF